LIWVPISPMNSALVSSADLPWWSPLLICFTVLPCSSPLRICSTVLSPDLLYESPLLISSMDLPSSSPLRISPPHLLYGSPLLISSPDLLSGSALRILSPDLLSESHPRIFNLDWLLVYWIDYFFTGLITCLLDWLLLYWIDDLFIGLITSLLDWLLVYWIDYFFTGLRASSVPWRCISPHREGGSLRWSFLTHSARTSGRSRGSSGTSGFLSALNVMCTDGSRHSHERKVICKLEFIELEDENLLDNFKHGSSLSNFEEIGRNAFKWWRRDICPGKVQQFDDVDLTLS
jgi:hypothetical protein